MDYYEKKKLINSIVIIIVALLSVNLSKDSILVYADNINNEKELQQEKEDNIIDINDQNLKDTLNESLDEQLNDNYYVSGESRDSYNTSNLYYRFNYAENNKSLMMLFEPNKNGKSIRVSLSVWESIKMKQ